MNPLDEHYLAMLAARVAESRRREARRRRFLVLWGMIFGAWILVLLSVNIAILLKILAS